MNPQDREEYGMDLAVKKREDMSEEYIKIEPKEAKVGDYVAVAKGKYLMLDSEKQLRFSQNWGISIYRKAEPKEIFEWVKPNTDTKSFPVITKEIADYLNKKLSEEYDSPDDLIINGYEQGLFNSLPNLTNEEWKGLETYYMPNVGVMRKIIDRIMEIRKGEV